jgi:hypothetical protein
MGVSTCLRSPEHENITEWADSFCNGAYPLDRLAAALFVNCPNPKGRLMALFSAYFDASGTPDQPFLVMAGYIASYIQWRVFESHWKQIHEEYDLKIPFHMADFVEARRNPARYALQRGARADYVEIVKDSGKAERFLQRLCMAQATVVNCGITCMVPMNIYNEVSSLLNLREVIPPYALAARMCIAKVHKWEEYFGISEPVQCIFELGDLEQAKFTELMRSEGSEAPIYRRKEDYAGLQAADHYAWEQFYFRKKERTGGYIPDTALSVLVTAIPYLNVEPTIGTLIDLCHAKGIDPATGIRK